MDQVAEARRQREQLQSRCAEMEDLLAGTQRDAQVSRDRLAWLEDVLAAAQRSSAEIQADGFEDLKQHCVVAAETSKQLGPDADLDLRFDSLGKGIDLEHRIKAALMNVVGELNAIEARNRDLESRLLELTAVEARNRELESRLLELEATTRRELIELAAKSGASHEEREHIRAELASVESAMAKLRDDENTIRQLRAVLGLDESAPPEGLVHQVRNLRSTVDDRDRWVAALLSELSSRRLKLSRRGLMEHERKFLEDRDRAEGS